VFSAVHSDRSGRIVVAADYGAALSDGHSVRAFARAISLPPGTEVVALADREAVGLDRAGRVRPLGDGRWAVGAILPLGHLRTALPAYLDESTAPALRPRGYAAVGADENGELTVCATALEPDARASDGRASSDLAARLSAGLRERPSSRLVRQLVRCARDYRCRAAANAFLGRYDCALPIAAPANEQPPAVLALRDDADESPTEPAAFHPTALEIADVAVAHLDGGGALVAFGRACEGEPLLVARMVESAIAAIRSRTGRGAVHLETNGSAPAALRRLREAGLDSVAFRMISARSETYELLHRPSGYRFTDVRAGLAEAVTLGLAVAVAFLVLPGLTDRPAELDALLALAYELPQGSALILRDGAADPQRALALVRSPDAPAGIEPALERLRAETPHLRLIAQARPLARV